MALPTEVKQGLYIRAGRVGNKVPSVGSMYSNITGNNATRKEVWGNCTYIPPGGGQNTPAYLINANLPANFMFIGNIPNGVAIGVIPKAYLTFPIYVFSDNFGGCQFHIVSSQNAVAFLHVYRGRGTVAQYGLSNGWTYIDKIESANVPAIANAAQTGQAPDVGAFAYIAAGSNIAECCFLEFAGGGRVHQVHAHKAVTF